MSLLAVLLVLLSAFLHATWNLLAKRVARGAAFVWLLSLCSALLLLPASLYVGWNELSDLGPRDLLFMALSGVLHVGYMLSLQRGYRAGDLSLVYPLARGTGPALAVIGAVLLFGETPAPLALVSVALVVLGSFLLAGGSTLFGSADGLAVGFGLLTGLFIASYTLTDAHAVTNLALHPLIFLWLSGIAQLLLLTPVAFRRRAEVQQLWRTRKREVVAVAALSPLAYLLVLFALQLAPVSYVAPARELSILIGTVLGAGLLKEGARVRRLGAAAVMVAGVYLLTVTSL